MATLVNQVGSNIGVTISPSSTPSRSEVLQWLNDGFNYLKRALPPEYFYNSMDTASDTDATSIDVPSDYVKLIMAVRDATSIEYPVEMKNPVEYLNISTGRESFRQPSANYPVGSFYGGKFKFAKDTDSTSDDWKLYYIKESSVSSESESASEHPVIDTLLVEYGTMRFKFNEEEMEQFSIKVQQLMANQQEIGQNIQFDFSNRSERTKDRLSNQ